jgi:hypothetical protein
MTIMLMSCSRSLSIPFERTGEVNAVSHENSIVVLRSQGHAENRAKALYHAERNAMENLIFKGIPNTNQESPLVDNETKALGSHKSFFKNFFVDQGYKRYIMESYTSHASVNKGVSYLEQEIKIDLKSLRNALQQEGITRKFGL